MYIFNIKWKNNPNKTKVKFYRISQQQTNMNINNHNKQIMINTTEDYATNQKIFSTYLFNTYPNIDKVLYTI